MGGAAYSDPYPHLPAAAAAAEVQEADIAKTLMRAQHSELILDIEKITNRCFLWYFCPI